MKNLNSGNTDEYATFVQHDGLTDLTTLEQLYGLTDLTTLERLYNTNSLMDSQHINSRYFKCEISRSLHYQLLNTSVN